MVNELDVLDVLKNIKDISQYNEDDVAELCRRSLEAVISELKSDADILDPRVINAAAAQTFYLLCVKERENFQNEITSFKAGDVSITQKEKENGINLEEAKSLCEKTKKSLIPLMEDNGFFCGKVDI